MAKKIYLESKSQTVIISLFGISCHLRDYRLSFLMNQIPGFSFTRKDDLHIVSSVHKWEADFSFFSHYNEEKQTSFFLISNRSQEFVLVPEMKQFDFLLFVEGKFSKLDKDPVIQAIRALPGVLTVFESKLSEVKNYESLLSDIEMHVMDMQKTPAIRYQPGLTTKQ